MNTLLILSVCLSAVTLVATVILVVYSLKKADIPTIEVKGKEECRRLKKRYKVVAVAAGIAMVLLIESLVVLSAVWQWTMSEARVRTLVLSLFICFIPICAIVTGHCYLQYNRYSARLNHIIEKEKTNSRE